MAKVLFKRKTTDEIKELEIQDGALIYNTDNGKTYMDFGEERIQTGGNADTMIAIGGEEPTDEDIKIWIKDKDNQNYNNFYYRKNDNKFEQMFLQPIGDTLPIGAITEFGGETAPTNWLFCNGQAVSRETYAELFSVIGTTYGDGDGSTTFNLPDFSSRSPMGVGEGTDGTNTETTTLGQEKGEYKHTLTIDEMPSHTHLYRASIGAGNAEGTLNFGSNGSVITGTYGNAIQNAGGSQVHNNIQPVLGVNFIIKAKQSVGIVGTVTSDINDTNDNAVPNAKTVKDYVEEVYSTDEVKTNKIWIDGKPIYRKVVTGTINASGNNQVILTGNIDSLIDYSGYINNPAENLKLIIGKSTYTDGGSSRIIQISNSLYMGYANNYHNLGFYAVVEYTKTTSET